LTCLLQKFIVHLSVFYGKVRAVSVLPILKYPDPSLRKISKPVEVVDIGVRRLIQDMFDTMYEAPGIGLAAPQVGRLLRVVVLDVSSQQEGLEPLALVNPVIEEGQGEVLWEEGCLSVPGLSVEVPRYERIRVSGLDLDGRPLQIEAEGLLSIVLQHEIDHLNGRLIIDRLSRLKREIYRKKRLKEQHQAAG